MDISAAYLLVFSIYFSVQVNSYETLEALPAHHWVSSVTREKRQLIFAALPGSGSSRLGECYDGQTTIINSGGQLFISQTSSQITVSTSAAIVTSSGLRPVLFPSATSSRPVNSAPTTGTSRPIISRPNRRPGNHGGRGRRPCNQRRGHHRHR